ncbi:hypothetical protein D3C78_528990 [compost metagenome]
MFKIMAVFLSGAVCAGCNGLVRPDVDGAGEPHYFRVFSGFPLPFLYMASAVQWNEEYAVTVRHIPLVSGKAHTCSTGCDLVFIRHRCDCKVPLWRAPRVGEKITAAGASPYLLGVTGQGKVYPAPFVNTDENSGDYYAIHDAPLVEGMSGGPVIGSDGQIVGINIGIYSTLLNNIDSPGAKGAKRISVFVPFAIIQREWNLLDARLSPSERQRIAAK